ncbi:MAG: ankyrin repeat domain-containing protein [Chthonomonadales bacterium]
MRLRNAFFLAAALLPASTVLAQTAPKAPTRKDIAQAQLFVALTSNNIKAVKAALDAGADPNVADFIDVPPLCFAADIPTVNLLLSRGAKLNAETIRGSALSNALLTGQDDLAIYFMDKGATPNAIRGDGGTALMYASNTGSMKSLRRLLKMKVNVNIKNNDGASALTYAARGNKIEAAKLLIAAGAKVNDSDSLKRTPLHHAALAGYGDMVAFLIAHGASVKAVDGTGSTPLHLAAHYSGDARTVQALLAGGASKSAKDANGKIAFYLASKQGYASSAKLLEIPGVTAPVKSPKVDATTVAAAIKPAMSVIQTSMEVYQKKAACVSCHHQGLGLFTVATAMKQQVPINTTLFTAYLQQMQDDGKENGALMHEIAMDPKKVVMHPVTHLGDLSYAMSYIFSAMKAAGVPPNPGVADAALVLAREQLPNGSWGMGPRGTMQHSNVTTTAMVLDILNFYYPADKGAQLATIASKAKKWVLTMKPTCAEDRASKLSVLKAAGGSESEIGAAAQELFTVQRSDGGWGTAEAMHSDAYTTGLSLHALKTAGAVSSTNPKVQKAVAYLLRTQDADGSWFVAKTTPAFNNHFDASFPHGYSQYSSFAGTCWATIGLMDVMDVRSASRYGRFKDAEFGMQARLMLPKIYGALNPALLKAESRRLKPE